MVAETKKAEVHKLFLLQREYSIFSRYFLGKIAFGLLWQTELVIFNKRVKLLLHKVDNVEATLVHINLHFGKDR